MEKLYNNIVLTDDFMSEHSDANHVPYLENPPEIIDISVGRQLFVDDFLIENTDLTQEFHQAKKDPQPVLYPETPWETHRSPCACPKSGGVWYDEEAKKFKMWYEAGWLHQMAYAESDDGIHWERPNLDLVPGTNQILIYEDDGHDQDPPTQDHFTLRPDSTAVIMDLDAPADQRYKLFLRGPSKPGLKFSGIVAVSEDGIHFRDYTLTGPVGDRTTVFYNPFRKKWVYSIRSLWKRRSRDYRECDDLLEGATWSSEELHQWMATDEFDMEDPYIRDDPQLYNVDAVGYESVMLGMFQIHYGPHNDIVEKYGVAKITELQPMFSRDGFHYSRAGRKSVVTASRAEETWDCGYIQSVGGVAIIHDDELWIYYSAFAGDRRYNQPGKFTNGMYRNGATGLARLRRDGFASMEGQGSLMTRKLTMAGKETFHINAVGKVKVSILDENGLLLAVSNEFSGDSTNAQLTFEGFDLTQLNNKVFRLRFDVDGALYAFGFADCDGDFGGAHAGGVWKKD